MNIDYILQTHGVGVGSMKKDTTPPPTISDFIAKGKNAQVVLTWTNPTDTDFVGVKIVRKIGSYPTSVSDGAVIYGGASNTYTDENVTNGTAYYYRAFPYDWDGNYNATEIGQEVTAIPFAFKTMGITIDLSNSNPETAVTYIDDAIGMEAGSSAWDEFFGHYPVMLLNGAENYKLNPNDFTKKIDGTDADITSGTDGDVMIAFPRRGLTISTVGTTVTVKMTDNPDDANFEYNAHTRGITSKDVFYLGAYKGYGLSSKLRSLSGKTPTGNQTIGTFRTQAQANGAGYENSGFFQLTFRQVMYILKYKNLNSQTAVGRGFVDGSSAATTTGSTNTRGMDWGEGTGKQSMKLFGLEDFWGNLFEWIDGIVTNSTRNILTATTSFNDTGSGYTDQGQGAVANIGNYMNKPQGTTETGFLAKEVTGSNSTYFCDYAYLNASCVAAFGGSWGVASVAGAFSLSVNSDASYATASRGARLMYL